MEELKNLERKLKGQRFLPQQEEDTLEEFRQMARLYSQVEHGIAVLSDLKADRSYIYKGAIAEALGLGSDEVPQEIASIWEEEIYNRIHPDDLAARHLLELQFFHLLKKTPVPERVHYRTHSIVRMLDAQGKYVPVLHRTFYLRSQEQGALWLALCLYNFATTHDLPQRFQGVIQHMPSGTVLRQDHQAVADILSEREKEVLRLIEQGLLSKEISEQLGISKNTVDRHRQNIMSKLQAGNCMEAIRIARALGI